MPVDPNRIWTGVSGGFTVVWNGDDIVVHRGSADGERVFSVRAAADRAWAASMAAHPRACTEDRHVQILSVVGPLLSLSIQADGLCEGAARPYSSHRWAVMDLSRMDRGAPLPLRLTALMPDTELLGGLLADPLVRAAIGPTAAPATLPELFAMLVEHPITVGACQFTLGDDELSGFAMFSLMGGDRMAVRIGLPARTEACRSQISQLGLNLPMPDRLRAELVQAFGRRAGFLLKDITPVAGGRDTTFHLASPPPSLPPPPPATVPAPAPSVQ